MQSSGGPGSAPPFTFPDLGPVVQDTQLRGPTGQVIDSSALASEASVSSGAGGSAGAAPSPTPASAGERGVAGSLQAAPSVVAHHASAASTGETSASSAVAPTLPTPALPSASGASSDPACTQLVPRSSPDSSPLHEPSSNATHFCRTGGPLPATACEASGLPPRSSAQWYAVEDIVHHEVQAAVEELREHSERRFANFAQLMVGLVRHPPLRVDYELDQRPECAQSLGEVVEALNPDPCGLPMGWDEEMRRLRFEETDLKNQAQVLCTRASFERNELFEVVKSLRHERDEVSRQLRKHNTAMATNDETIALLRSQCERYEASLKASDSLLAKDRELFKSGLQEYNRNMRQLRSLLINQARGQPEARELVRRMDDNVLPRAFDAFLEVFDSAYSAPGAAPATPSSRESSSRAGTTRHRAAAPADVQVDVSMEPAESGNDSDDESTSPPPAKRRKHAHRKSRETQQAGSNRATRLGRSSVNLQQRARARSACRPSSLRAPVESAAPKARPVASQSSAAGSAAPSTIPPASPHPSEASTALFSDSSEAEVEFETSDRNDEVEGKRSAEIRPASTTSSLRSMSDVERENAPGDEVIGDATAPSASEPSAPASPPHSRSQAEMSSFARASTPPAPVHGEQPLVRVSRKLPDTATPFIDPPFQAYGAMPCWCIIQNVRMPRPIAGDVMVECSVKGTEEWSGWTNPNRPFHRVLASMPDEPCLFEVAAFMPDVPISIRAEVRALLVKLWRQFTSRSVGRTEKNDLGFSLFERGHWISTTAVERFLQVMAETFGEESPEYCAILAAWVKYNHERNNCADRLRLQIPKRWWQWCFPSFAGHISCETETMLEPSVLQYSFENLTWAPRSDDWVSECLELDGHQPWRNCWVDVPSEHPYNTTFAPCNPMVPLFVPRGMTVREVATAVTINPVLDPRRVTAPWEDGQPGEDEVSEEEEVEELIEEIESPVAEESSEKAQDEETTQALGAQDAATATKDSVQDRVAALEAPVEEASASETPADTPSSSPSAADRATTRGEASPAARLRVLTKVASSSDA
ncbi:hypothetical protein PHYSODRAFT_341321 [Phytophthora sojae]|uniref:Uncharacterized protein n=1 Tax=Phytophthora sojae (strain P6497) TaxID=1094619 RepID=G5ACS5_PHYSP|nr:hypothetical protein PHYSODRAFT_341321 [Phytophthora sojae]EGZ07149.1 hypothetical protein PHYSODRAFT_341321 [Phytophthora sojae]|eukprot:XP_009537913.1 hypothetical protein PHYSODRAFT_341321 [Phytophthora sojae]